MEEYNDATGDGRTSRYRDWVSRNIFAISNLAGVLLGLGIGLIVKIFFPLSDQDIMYIGFPGKILMKMFEIVSVPLILITVIRGASQKVDIPEKLARNMTLCFASATLMSVTIGLVLVVRLKPGVVKMEDEKNPFADDSILDLVRNLVMDNLIRGCFQQYQTDRVVIEDEIEPNSSLETKYTQPQVILVDNYVDEINILGLIMFSLVYGLRLKIVDARGRAIVDSFNILNKATKYVVYLIKWYLPIGLMFMIISHIVELQDWESLYSLGYFMAVVLLGQIIHGAVVLPGVYLLSVRSNPWVVFKGISPALWTVLRTSSSSAALPHIFQCCEQTNGINLKITRFMLSIGINVNLNGTALYEVVAAIFIAQLKQINLDSSKLICLGVTAVIFTLSRVGIPRTGATTTLFVLGAAGVPAKEAAILEVVKLLLLHCNTFVDVWGNCLCVALINKLSINEIEDMENQDATGEGDI